MVFSCMFCACGRAGEDLDIYACMWICIRSRVSRDICFSVDIILNTLVSDLGLSADVGSAVIFFRFFFSLQRSSEHPCICQWKHPVLEGCLLLLAGDRCPGSYDCRYIFLLFSLVMQMIIVKGIVMVESFFCLFCFLICLSVVFVDNSRDWML